MTTSGWYPDVQTDLLVRYWDGTAWIAERVWDGTVWVDQPLGTGAIKAVETSIAAVDTDDGITQNDLTVPPLLVGAETVVGPTRVDAPDPVEVELPTPPPSPAAAVSPMVPPPVVASPVLPPPGASTSGSWRRPFALLMLGVVVAAASALVTYLVRHDNSSDSSSTSVGRTRVASGADRPAKRTSTSTTTSTTTTLPAAIPVTTPGVTPVLGRVARTCGASGRGDCFVSVRTAPNGASPEVRRIVDGQAIAVVCQVPGESVQSSVLGSSSAAWSRTSDGMYVASIYVDAPGFAPQSVSVPCP